MSRRRESGYLLEVPIILVVVGVLLAVLVPKLQPAIGKPLVVAGAVVAVACLYYMIVVPGWQPGDASRLRRPWNLLAFALVAGLLGLVTAAYVIWG